MLLTGTPSTRSVGQISRCSSSFLIVAPQEKKGLPRSLVPSLVFLELSRHDDTRAVITHRGVGLTMAPQSHEGSR